MGALLSLDDQAKEAANLYVSVFAGRSGATAGSSKVLNILHYGDAGPGEAGSVMTVSLQLEGQEFTALNGGHKFQFNEAMSLSVNCETQDEVDEHWSKLSEDGEEGPCGWLRIDTGSLGRSFQRC